MDSRLRGNDGVKSLQLPQARDIDHEAIPHVALQHSFPCRIDLINANHFDICGNVVRRAEVEHLLRLGDAADERPRELPVPRDEGEGIELRRLGRGACRRGWRVPMVG